MAEIRDDALLLRCIPYSETSFICHFLTTEHGRIALMARGARRPKSPFRAGLATLHPLHIHWRPGRTGGMGMLLDVQRGACLLDDGKMLQGLELLALASGLFQEGDPHGCDELKQAIEMLQQRQGDESLCAAAWVLLNQAGWLGDLSHCWHCGETAALNEVMYWQSAQLICAKCGSGQAISAGLRKGVSAVLEHKHIRLSHQDTQQWRSMITLVLQSHGVKLPETFR